MKRFVLTMLSAVTLASAAWAGDAAKLQQVSLPVGNTTTLALAGPITKVRVADPSKVRVSSSGRTLTVVGLALGTTDAVVRTTEGELTLHIYVAADKYALPYH